MRGPLPGTLAIVVMSCGGSPPAAQREAAPTEPAGAASRVESARAATPGRAIVALEGSDRVAVLAAGPRWRVVRRLRVPDGPHNVAASRALGLAAVTSPPAGRVTLMDRRGVVVARARVAGSPHAAAFVPGRSVVWIAAETASRLVALAPRSGRVLRSVPTGGPPHNLAASPDGRRLWVTVGGSAAVEVRDAASGRLLRRDNLGGAPHDLAFAPGGQRVWLSNFRSSRLTIASAGGRRLGTLSAGTEPHHFTFGLGRLWASDNGGGRILRIASGRRRIAGRTRVGAAPHHVAVAGRSVLAAVNGTGRVAVLSRTGRLLQRVSVGVRPHGIGVLPG